ncbi:hypothetical protein [Pseudomonas plecoglossicida]|uniref:hypothetical protein n=1 Tax=Pseudomonas plecoglossicida TaxID=70775 RepID=UPI003CF06B25
MNDTVNPSQANLQHNGEQAVAERPDLGPWLEVCCKSPTTTAWTSRPSVSAWPRWKMPGHWTKFSATWRARQALRCASCASTPRPSSNGAPAGAGARRWPTAVVEAVTEENELAVVFAGDQRLTSRLPRSALEGRINRVALMRPARPLRDVRTDDYTAPYDRHWFAVSCCATCAPTGR